MNRFFQDLKQPYWWIGVVVVGLLLNVVSSYIRQWIDRSALKIFSSLKARSERRRKRIEEAAAIVRGNDLTRMYYLVRSISIRLRGVVSLMLAMLLLIIAIRVPEIWGTLFVFFAAAASLTAMRMDLRAKEMEEAIQEAIRQETDQQAEVPPRIQPDDT